MTKKYGFSILVPKILSDALARVKKKTSADDIRGTFSEPEVQERLNKLEKKLVEFGRRLPSEDSEATDDKAAGRKAVGALGKNLLGSARSWFIRSLFIKLFFWMAVVLVLFMAIVNFVPGQIKKIQNQSPELYCAAIYWLNDTHIYGFCEDISKPKPATPTH